MGNKVHIIVQETVQKVYELDSDDPLHAVIYDQFTSAHFTSNVKAPPMVGKRAVKGSRPYEPPASIPLQAAYRSLAKVTVLNLDEKGAPYFQTTYSPTTCTSGPVKS